MAQELDLHPAHTHTGTCLQPGAIVSTLSPVSTAYVVDGESMVVPEIVGSRRRHPRGVFEHDAAGAALANIWPGSSSST